MIMSITWTLFVLTEKSSDRAGRRDVSLSRKTRLAPFSWEQCPTNGPIQQVVCRSKGLHPGMLYHERLCFPQRGEGSGVEEQDEAELHGTPKAVFTPFDRGGLQERPPVLHPTDHGWYHPEGSTMLFPTIVPQGTPLAPADLLKLIKCSCFSDNPCSSKRCSCKANGLGCTLFCHFKGEQIIAAT